MPHIDPEILHAFGAKYMANSKLTPSERGEMLRLAQGLGCKDSAAQANVSSETIRARRKRIYHKLNVGGSNELISSMLAFALTELAKEAGEIPQDGVLLIGYARDSS